MSRVPPPSKPSYFRIEAILEAPVWALVLGIVLMTVAVALQVINQV